MDGLNLEEELDHTVHSQEGDQRQVDKVQTGEDPEPDIGPLDQTEDTTCQPTTPQSRSVSRTRSGIEMDPVWKGHTKEGY